MVEKMSKCNHPIKKQKIWRIWTTHFHQENVQRSTVKIVLECECGHRESLESELGDKNPLGGF